jgi:hypothetical protein
MSFFDFLKKKKEAETPARPRTKKVIHYPRTGLPHAQAAEPESPAGTGMEAGQPVPPESSLGENPQAGTELPESKFQAILGAEKKKRPARLPRKYLVRTAMWDVSSIVSLSFNAILLAVVLLLASRIHTLQNTLQDTLQNKLNGLLGGLYDNFVRMDESYITTTILVEDMPIPLDFTLPVVQEQTNVTLTQDVTIHNAYVAINTGTLNISAPATVTLPAGTTLPVSLQMDVPVQTTVLMDLQVPVNIQLANANSSDPAIANLHTAFLGLQDTIGPLYCLLSPTARDYLSQPLCNDQGAYVNRRPPTP